PTPPLPLPLFPYTTLFRSPKLLFKESFVTKVRARFDKRVVLKLKTEVRLRRPILHATLPIKVRRAPIHYAPRDQSCFWFWLVTRSEEHTSELQSRGHLVCR